MFTHTSICTNTFRAIIPAQFPTFIQILFAWSLVHLRVFDKAIAKFHCDFLSYVFPENKRVFLKRHQIRFELKNPQYLINFSNQFFDFVATSLIFKSSHHAIGRTGLKNIHFLPYTYFYTFYLV